MLPSPARRALPPALVGLVVALLPLLATAPAGASPGCLQESGALGGCDDVEPPVFTAANVSVAVAAQGGAVAVDAVVAR